MVERAPKALVVVRVHQGPRANDRTGRIQMVIEVEVQHTRPVDSWRYGYRRHRCTCTGRRSHAAPLLQDFTQGRKVVAVGRAAVGAVSVPGPLTVRPSGSSPCHDGPFGRNLKRRFGAGVDRLRGSPVSVGSPDSFWRTFVLVAAGHRGMGPGSSVCTSSDTLAADVVAALSRSVPQVPAHPTQVIPAVRIVMQVSIFGLVMGLCCRCIIEERTDKVTRDRLQEIRHRRSHLIRVSSRGPQATVLQAVAVCIVRVGFEVPNPTGFLFVDCLQTMRPS